MNAETQATSVPAAWLKRLPAGYKIPLWRWLLLPATALMLKRQGGVWISGTLTLTPDELRFAQSRMIKSARVPPETWTIALGEISDTTLTRGIASETLEIHGSEGVVKLMTARAQGFVDSLRQAVAAAGGEKRS